MPRVRAAVRPEPACACAFRAGIWGRRCSCPHVLISLISMADSASLMLSSTFPSKSAGSRVMARSSAGERQPIRCARPSAPDDVGAGGCLRKEGGCVLCLDGLEMAVLATDLSNLKGIKRRKRKRQH